MNNLTYCGNLTASSNQTQLFDCLNELTQQNNNLREQFNTMSEQIDAINESRGQITPLSAFLLATWAISVLNTLHGWFIKPKLEQARDNELYNYTNKVAIEADKVLEKTVDRLQNEVPASNRLTLDNLQEPTSKIQAGLLEMTRENNKNRYGFCSAFKETLSCRPCKDKKKTSRVADILANRREKETIDNFKKLR